MTSIDSTDNQRISLDLAIGNSDNLESCVSKITCPLRLLEGIL